MPEGKRFSKLEELRKLERRDSGPGMERALARVEKALALRARSAQVQAIPANRLSALAKYGMASKAPLLKDLAEPRRTATLLMTARHLEAAAVDALDLFDSLMATRLISPARGAGQPGPGRCGRPRRLRDVSAGPACWMPTSTLAG